MKIILLELGRDKPKFKVGDKYTIDAWTQITIHDENDSIHFDRFENNEVKYFYPAESRIEVKGNVSTE